MLTLGRIDVYKNSSAAHTIDAVSYPGASVTLHVFENKVKKAIKAVTNNSGMAGVSKPL